MTGRPFATLATCATLAILGAVIAVSGLRVDADTNSLIGDDRPFMRAYDAFMAEFGDLEAMHLVVDAGDPPRHEEAAAAIDELLERARTLEGVLHAHGRIEPREQWRLATRSLPVAELEQLSHAAGAFDLLCSDLPTTSLYEEADDRLRRLLGTGLLLEEEEARTIGSEAFFLLQSLAGGPENSGEADAGRFSFAGRLEPEYLRSSTGRMYFIEVMPKKDFGSLAVIDGPLAGLRAIIEEVGARHPGIEIGLTGKPVLQADEMATTESDMTRASLIALGLITLLFVIVFRGFRRPLSLVLSFLLAFGWTYGLVTLLVGRLNLLSMVFMLVMVGIGVDYGIHVLTSWVEARRDADATRSVRRTLERTMPGNLTGALTSAGVFLLALLTDFQGLRELGLIAATGLTLCLVAMTITLPCILHLLEHRSSKRAVLAPDPGAIDGGRRRRNPIGTVGLAVAVLGALVFAVTVPTGLRYQSNLLELQADGLDSVGWEERLFEDDSSSSWFAAVVVDSIDEIPGVIEKAKRRSEIGPIRSVLDIVAPPTPERDAYRAAIARSIPEIEDVRPRPASHETPPSPRLLEGIAGRLEALDRLAGERRDAGSPPSVGALVEGLRARTADFESEEAIRMADALHDLDRARSNAVENLLALGSGASGSLRDALPAALRARFVSPGGRHMVMLQPAEDVWSMEAMRPFIEAIRMIDPEVTGVPITQYESMNDMTRSFALMVVGAICLVLIVIWLDFRSIPLTLACLTTLLTGMLWTLGLMMILGIPLNLANFFAIPILIGLGCDGAIHVTHRWKRISTGNDVALGSTTRAVVLTSVTTCLGFGALFTAEHHGLRSLGGVMVVGSLCCLVSTILVLPALLDRFTPRVELQIDSQDVQANHRR